MTAAILKINPTPDYSADLDPAPWPDAPPRIRDLKRFAGDYMVLKETRSDNGAPEYSSEPGDPRLHATLESAEADVCDLLAQFPDETFVIVRQLARAKMKAVANG